MFSLKEMSGLRVLHGHRVVVSVRCPDTVIGGVWLPVDGVPTDGSIHRIKPSLLEETRRSSISATKL